MAGTVLTRRKDIAADRLTSRDEGETKPAFSNATREGRAKSRSVELILKSARITVAGRKAAPPGAAFPFQVIGLDTGNASIELRRFVRCQRHADRRCSASAGSDRMNR